MRPREAAARMDERLAARGVFSCVRSRAIGVGLPPPNGLFPVPLALREDNAGGGDIGASAGFLLLKILPKNLRGPFRSVGGDEGVADDREVCGW